MAVGEGPITRRGDGKDQADRENEEREKEQLIRAKRMKGIAEVLEEVDVLIDTHFFDEFR